MNMTIGETRITFDLSYLRERTEEQAKLDEERLADAVWNLYDELEEAI